jgi:hypothetical protein
LGRSCIDVLYNKINAACAEKCATEPDPCAATGSDKYCVNGSAPIDPATNPEGPAGYTCPAGEVCEYTGFIEGGGKTCYLFKTWTIDEIPSDCIDTGCNCGDDCPDCQVCNGNGECESDPACENILWDLYTRRTGDSAVGSSCGFHNDYPLGTFLEVSNVPTDEIENYQITVSTSYWEPPPAYTLVLAPGTSFCGFTCPGYITFERLVYTPTGNTVRNLGYADGCRRTDPFAGTGNNFAYELDNEIIWVLAGSGPPP